MKDELKRIFLAGVGSVSYTYDKASNILDDLVKRGKITLEEGKEISQELRRNFKTNTTDIKNKTENIEHLTRKDVNEIVNNTPCSSAKEIGSLKERVSKLEGKIDYLIKYIEKTD